MMAHHLCYKTVAMHAEILQLLLNYPPDFDYKRRRGFLLPCLADTKTIYCTRNREEQTTREILFLNLNVFNRCELWSVQIDQWWANYGPRARYGPWNVLSGPRDIIPNLTNKKEYIPVRIKLWETFRNAVTVSFITFSFIIFQSLIGLSITKNTRIL